MEYYIGQTGEFTKTITESDVCLFAGITGDFNEVHINEIAAQNSRFKKRVVHGALTSSLISTVLGTKMPGAGTVYLEQKSSFMKPVYINDTLTARVSIKSIDGDMAVLSTVVHNQNDVCVLDGEAKVLLPKESQNIRG